MCLIAPSVHHRIEFRHQDKERIVQTGNRIVIVGLALLAIAMTGAVMFITDVLYGGGTTALVAGGVAAGFAVIWYAVPLRRLAGGR
jgi:hypothetical protein